MRLNEQYSIHQIKSAGMVEKSLKDLNAKIFTGNDKVYFFENVGNKRYRLYSVINKRSFFL